MTLYIACLWCHNLVRPALPERGNKRLHFGHSLLTRVIYQGPEVLRLLFWAGKIWVMAVFRESCPSLSSEAVSWAAAWHRSVKG